MPVRQLLILRHAKSSWDDPKLDDFDRPLAPRGLKTAPLIGRELSRRGWLPELALVSPALRTRDTWRLVAQELPKHVSAQFAEELYEAAPATILACVRRAKATNLLVIGHNPGLQNFALRLAGAGSDESMFKKIEAKFPTAALARFTVKDDWSNLDFGGARLTHFVRPKDLE
ncbi:histidine phosphatase family protein [Mesorhizobium sp. M2D.F.Ca.ET.185.01.1.1]|uniref:SixA phosphatase family protein n=1 Tax=unclassified Mesorhizobium TaxID=325217 RepID=UPI000FC9C724|nr:MULTISPECIES: histidine phosphatase family protein [unclassified Mesorhizobium]TGP77022.1 histidine phosphatase family protein [bacterium M00.F.Ca.ET.227.01.1.1]TGP84851.1 histidine phosphatase family protein [bacterium M00.F.Ca.ET.221.01.1.1]TGP88421.1 histidine phosphatase family protein [bacterium M00.F.Ca.ET.222.01.1.1]TGT68679.1 histidine phosphatase family protein [bacterium M00.F.Ca.ET.159.01.1.1]TGT80513.1 histidine phosphatase family protein [bacterium M00.F.Ca.ET.157.01.1.1]TGT95